MKFIIREMQYLFHLAFDIRSAICVQRKSHIALRLSKFSHLTSHISIRNSNIFLLSSFCFVLSSCEPKVNVPTPTSGNADFSRYVAIGSSYTAGFADGALSKEGQQAAFPSLLVRQMRLVGGADTFNIPLLKGSKGVYPGDNYAPGSFNLTDPKFILVKKEDCKGEVSILPERLPGLGDNELDINDESQRIYNAGDVYHNLGIPAMKLIHFTSSGYGDVANYGTTKAFSPYFWRIAPLPLFLSSMFSYLDASFTDNTSADPTFFTFELGMNDVLAYAIAGGIGRTNSDYDDDITSVSRFRTDFNLILEYLASLEIGGVIANIPDITTFPYFTTIEFDALDLDAAKADSMNKMYANNPNVGAVFHEGENNPFVIREDGVVRTIKPTEFVLLGVDVDSLKCMHLGSYIPISDEYILSETEIANIKSFTEEYNSVIREVAEAKGFSVVDLAGFMRKIYLETTIDGISLSAEFASGGFFSLDGLHPNDRGHALIANEFIKVINRSYGAQIPLLNITEFRGVLFP